jgi:hypothetical protein
MKKTLIIILCLIAIGFAMYLGINPITSDSLDDTETIENNIISSTNEVAAYIHTYHTLPDNYITKSKASSRGWISTKGNLWDVTDHKVIGGDIFYNREGLLPDASGRTWKECDVNYKGGYRGAERLVYSNDWLIL